MQNPMGKFLDPVSIISQLGVEAGSVAVDFGCGPGYFSIPFAKAVGENGFVHSLDILPQSLETVIGRAKNSGITNIATKRVNLEKENGSKLQSEIADWVIMKDILFQNKEKGAIINEAHRILKKGGKVILVEWNSAKSAVGPVPELRIDQISAEKMFSAAGFIVEKSVEAGHFHYAFIAIKE